MSLRDFIFRNFWLKTFSVVLATAIWFFIHDGIRQDAALHEARLEHGLPQGYIRVPVTIQTEPGDKRVFRWEPTEVVVIAQGEDAALRRGPARHQGLSEFDRLSLERAGYGGIAGGSPCRHQRGRYQPLGGDGAAGVKVN